MLNHVEIQGKIGNLALAGESNRSFMIHHARGFGDGADAFNCAVDDERIRQYIRDTAQIGRTVIVTGRLRACRVCSYEIVCETVDYVDGGGANAD